jgi:uncharacterized iron-regulated protein
MRLSIVSLASAVAIAMVAWWPLGHAAGTTDAHPLTGKIWDARQGHFISAAELLGKLAATDFVLLGEVHDNPEHHSRQAFVLQSLIQAGRRPALVMEQLDRENQPAIDAALTAGADAEDVAAAGRMDRKGWQWANYQPLMHIAIGARLPIVAANLSRSAARDVAEHGFDRLDVPPAALAIPDVWTNAREDALVATIVEGHCGQLRAQDAGPIARAQRARDAVMADILLRHRNEGAVVVAGAGHARRDLAVPLYLRARAPGAGIVSIAFTEVEAGIEAAAAYETASATGPGDTVFDYLWFSPRAERDDPCADLKMPRPPR